jgi:predicted alpha/beta superfamily hydrolase
LNNYKNLFSYIIFEFYNMKTKLFFLFFIGLILTINTNGQVPVFTSVKAMKQLRFGMSDVLFSNELNEERTLNIYLPDGYDDTDTATKYPIVVLLDGGMDEDFIHTVGVYQFNQADWVDGIEKSIVLGICNVDRKRDFTHNTSTPSELSSYPTAGNSTKFIAFLKNELLPFVANKYRTNGKKTIIGQSIGGLLATEILLKHTALFNRYFIVSPSLWWDGGSLLHDTKIDKNKSCALTTEVYIAVGREGLAPGADAKTMEVDATMLMEKLQFMVCPQWTLHFDYLPNENHATIMHQALMNAVRWSGKLR